MVVSSRFAVALFSLLICVGICCAQTRVSRVVSPFTAYKFNPNAYGTTVSGLRDAAAKIKLDSSTGRYPSFVPSPQRYGKPILIPLGAKVSVTKSVPLLAADGKTILRTIWVLHVDSVPAGSDQSALGASVITDQYDLLQGVALHKVDVETDFGTLVVPYKFEISDKTVQPGGTVGAYAGITINGKLHIDGFFGFTPASGSTTNGAGVTSSTTFFGLSGGAALFYDLNATLQAGIVIGIDHAGDNSGTFKYNDRPWASLSLGYKFNGA